jgi:hypothetical protein
MATHVRPTDQLGSTRSGTTALVLGLLCAAAVAFTYVLSLSADVNPPNWVRALGMMWLPVGLVGTPLAYAVARHGEGRGRALAGLVIMAVSLVAFAALVVAIG